ncbi:MAG: hypothetical protein IT244_11385 [Bacteroidia bacterium]|nr:hypothetical protein [Bacteroidia bacterium]
MGNISVLIRVRGMKNEGNTKVSVFKDNIHGYIHITPLEKQIIENPIFQRLRFVGQNSLVYYTYASNHSDRFCHSLGVMHLGGQMFKQAVENAEDETLLKFLRVARELVASKTNAISPIGSLFSEWGSEFGNIASITHPIFDSGANDLNVQEEIALLNILWQSVRIACIAHDIGHYPFSHLFEYALEGYVEKNKLAEESDIISNNLTIVNAKFNENLRTLGIYSPYKLPLHEMKGIDIIMGLKINGDINKACLHLSKVIFVLNKGKHGPEKSLNLLDSIISCLHTIISSELDADRLDYCIRDPKSSSSELGAIDLDRILESIKLHLENEQFKIVLKPQAQSAIEEFFHQRYLMYKYIIHHHNVLRCDKALELLIRKLFDIYSQGKERDIIQRLQISGFITCEAKNQAHECILSKYNYEYYDDNWLRALLQNIYHDCTKKEIRNDNLNELLEVVLYRKIEHIVPLWKRESDIQYSLDTIESRLINEYGISFEKMENKIIEIINDLLNLESEQYDKLKNILESECGIELFIADCTPKIFKDKEPVEIFTKNGLVHVSDISIYLRSLKETTRNVVNPRLFFVKNKVRSDREYHQKCSSIFNDFIVQLIVNQQSQTN